MLQLTIGTNNLRLTLQNPVALASVTLRLTNQTTGKVTTATVVSPAYDGRLFTGQISVNTPPYSASSIDLTEPDNPQGFYLAELRSGTTVMASFSAYLEFEQAPQSYDPDAPYVAYDYSLNCEPATVTDGDGTVHEVSAGGSYTCLPSTPKSGIFYQRVMPWDGYDYSAVVGSVEWHRKEGTYNYTPPNNPLRLAMLADTYAGTDALCLLKSPNSFGNYFRFTNDIGQQFVEDFNQSGSNTSTNKKYLIDHLTGLAVYVFNYVGDPILNLNWNDMVQYAHDLSYAGYEDWRLASQTEYIALFSNFISSNAWDAMYAPWVDPNIRGFGGSFWLGSADQADSTNCHTFVTNGATIGEISKTSTRSYGLIIRNHR